MEYSSYKFEINPEGKDKSVLDIVFTFGFGFADTWLGIQYDTPLTNIQRFVHFNGHPITV